MKSRRLSKKFNTCVKAVRRTVRARKGSNKESAAIAICTKTVLQRRGKTLKRYRKGRLTTQRKLRRGGELPPPTREEEEFDSDDEEEIANVPAKPGMTFGTYDTSETANVPAKPGKTYGNVDLTKKQPGTTFGTNIRGRGKGKRSKKLRRY